MPPDHIEPSVPSAFATLTTPPGYLALESPSTFVNHIGPVYRRWVGEGAERESWFAAWVQEHHVNTWQLCHGAMMSAMADIATTGSAHVPDGPPTVTVSLTTNFIKAPKLGELIEACGRIKKETRTLVFVEAEASVGGELVFTATAVCKKLKG